MVHLSYHLEDILGRKIIFVGEVIKAVQGVLAALGYLTCTSTRALLRRTANYSSSLWSPTCIHIEYRTL